MRKGSFLLLLFAIAMGGVAAYMARNWIAAHAVPPAPGGTVVVAAAPLGFGTALSRENVTEIPWA
jgi:pilus assembly protein CpaB